MSEKNKEITELIDKIRGTTPTTELQKEVEAIIKADEEKAKIKAEADKKVLEDIKTKEALLRKKDKKKEKETVDTEEELPEPPERDKGGKFKKKEPETPEEQKEQDEADSETVKKLTEQMAKLSEEIEALKKRKNYRTAPPAAKKVDEVDDFIKQNITKDFEMVV